jgi:hypothetical protein
VSNILKQRLAAQQVAAEAEHPSADTLVAFTEQGLRGSENQRVLSHLAACPACRQTVSLATSVEPISPVALPSRSQGSRFPVALRWASAAAALAVAIGVGVLSYEHQNRPTFTAVSASQSEAKSVATPAPPGIEQNSEVAETQTKAQAERKSVKPRTANSQARMMADASRRTVEPQLKRSQGGVLGSLVAGSRPTTTLARPNVTDGFMASNAVAPPLPPAPVDAKASTVSDIGAAGAVVGGAAAPSAAAPSAAAQPVVKARSNVQLEAASKAAKVEGSSYNGTTRASLQQRPASLAEMKAVAPSAIGGPVRKGTIHGFAPIAHWTISSNGKLQRESGDGRFTSIEPAPGVSIRAVAAQGIEVWAAGAQPDLSAKQWQQRPVLFHSSDAGESWAKIDGPWQSPINALSLDGANALTVTTPDGSWTTLNGGKIWTKK